MEAASRSKHDTSTLHIQAPPTHTHKTKKKAFLFIFQGSTLYLKTQWEMMKVSAPVLCRENLESAVNHQTLNRMRWV